MEITYAECKDEFKLFSFFGHDYQTHTTKDGVFGMIDGGASIGMDCFRYGGEVEIKKDKIENLIQDIRRIFIWGQNYDANNKKLPATVYKPLQDLNTSHIIGILKYFTEQVTTIDKEWKIIHLIFLEELQFRNKLKIE